MVLVDRLVDRMSAIRVIVMSWLRSRPAGEPGRQGQFVLQAARAAATAQPRTGQDPQERRNERLAALPQARDRHRTSYAHGVVARQTRSGRLPITGALMVNDADPALRAQKESRRTPATHVDGLAAVAAGDGLRDAVIMGKRLRQVWSRNQRRPSTACQN